MYGIVRFSIRTLKGGDLKTEKRGRKWEGGEEKEEEEVVKGGFIVAVVAQDEDDSSNIVVIVAVLVVVGGRRKDLCRGACWIPIDPVTLDTTIDGGDQSVNILPIKRLRFTVLPARGLDPYRLFYQRRLLQSSVNSNFSLEMNTFP